MLDYLIRLIQMLNNWVRNVSEDLEMVMIDGRRAAAFLWTGGDADVPSFIAGWVRAVTEQLLRERLDCRGHINVMCLPSRRKPLKASINSGCGDHTVRTS